MRNYLLLVVGIIAHFASAATFYSKPGQTNPNLLTNWTTNPDGTGFTPFNFRGGDIFVIQTGHHYITTDNWTVNGVNGILSVAGIELTADIPAIVQVNGTLTLNHTLTLGKAGVLGLLTSDAEDRLVVNGTLNANAQNRFLVAGGIFTINTGGRYVLNHTLNNNSTTTFSGIEQFAAGSNFEYQNYGSENFTAGINYGNLILNAEVSKVFTATDFGVSGNLTVAKGTWAFNRNQTVAGNVTVSGGVLSQGTTNSSNTLNIGGNLFMNGGRFNISNAANNARTHSVAVAGNVTVSGGILDLNAFSTSNTNHGKLFVNGNMNITGGEIKSTRVAAGGSTGVYFSGTGQQTFTWDAGTMATSANGIGRRFFYKTVSGPAGLNETYNGTVAQTTISGSEGTPDADFNPWPAVSNTVLKTLTINNASNVTLARNTMVNEKVIIYKGTVLPNGFTVTYGSTASLEYAGQVMQDCAWDGFPMANNPATMIINNAVGVTFNKNMVVEGNVHIVKGILDLGIYSLERNTIGGTLIMDAGTTLKIGGTSTFPTNFISHSLNSSAVVEYYGGVQNITKLNSVAGYPSLILSGTGIKTLGGNVAVANNLTVNSGTGLTVASGQSLTVGNNLVNNGGTVLIENNANLMQNAATTANTNTGEVTVKRDGSPLYRLDYTMWSAPTATSQTMAQFSQHTSPTRFYTYNPVTDFYETIPASSTFAAGHGYLIRMPNGDPAPGYVEGNTQITFHGTFTGKPNNGTYTRTLANLGAGYHLVGNPYPSTIEVAKFLAANENAIAGTIWIWRKKNNDDSPNSAYITVNRAGIYVGNNEPNTSTNPNGIINTGQGFLVKLKSLAAPASISFTNAMRNASTSSQFYRMNGGQESSAESHGVWLNLSSESGKFSQMYAGYIDGATNGIDSDLDSEYINDAPTVLASVIESKEFVIQGRTLPFSSSDVVRLLFKTDVAGDYKITIDHVNGLFSGSQDVFLKDNLMGITHNLKESAYSFSTETGSFDSRFEIVYNTTALSTENPAITSDKVIVYQNDNSISIASATATIKAITVFDMQGRKIYSKEDVNASDAVITGLTAKNQPLIITIQTVNGTVSKKIIF